MSARNQLRHPNIPKPGIVGYSAKSALGWDITKLLQDRPNGRIVLPVRDPGCLQSLRGRLDDHAERRSPPHWRACNLASLPATKTSSAGQLTIHAVIGAMTSNRWRLCSRMQSKARSRPHVSNDSPYSRRSSKPKEYRPDYPLSV